MVILLRPGAGQGKGLAGSHHSCCQGTELAQHPSPSRAASGPNQLSRFCSAPDFAFFLGWEEEVEPQKEPLWCAILCSHKHHMADVMGAAKILVLPWMRRGHVIPCLCWLSHSLFANSLIIFVVFFTSLFRKL